MNGIQRMLLFEYIQLHSESQFSLIHLQQKLDFQYILDFPVI